MFRALLLLLVGAACLTASSAEDVVKATAAAGKAPAPAVPKSTPAATKAPVPATPELPKEAATEPVTTPDKKDRQVLPLDDSICDVALHINGLEEVNLYDRDSIAAHEDVKLTSWVPLIFDNAKTSKELRMKESEVIKIGSVSSDTHQVMSYTNEIHASGKLSLTVMINTPLPRIELQKAQLRVRCDGFSQFAGVQPEHHHSSFPYDVNTDFNPETRTLIIDLPPMTTQRCALLRAVWRFTRCDREHACCTEHGEYHDHHKMCRYSHNPCVEHTYCTGHDSHCPQPRNKDHHQSCDWRGHGEQFLATAASHLKHTRMPASAAVSIASTTAAFPSYAEMEPCRGRCEDGHCHLEVKQESCCKEVLRHGDSYGYGAEPSYGHESKGGYSHGYDSYDDHGKHDGYDSYGAHGHKGGDYHGRYDSPYEGRHGDYGRYDAYAEAAAVNAGAEKDPASEIVKSPIGTGYMDCWHA